MDQTLFILVIILFVFSIACIPGSFMFLGNPFKEYGQLSIGYRFCFFLLSFATLAIIFALGELVLQYFHGRYFLQPFIAYGILSAIPSTASFALLATEDN